MNIIEKRNQIIAMIYQNMDKFDADETLKLIDELSTMAVKYNAVLPRVSNSVCEICGKPVHPSYNLCFEHLVCNVPKTRQTNC